MERPSKQKPQDTSLPGGDYYFATWTIPPNYGGMTQALLHRAKAFHEQAGVFPRIVTFDDRLDADATRDELVSRGAASSQLELLNLWSDSVASDPGLRNRRSPRRDHRQRGEVQREDTFSGGIVRREMKPTEERQRHIIWFRADGSRAISNLSSEENGRKDREIVLYAHDERVKACFRSWPSFASSWLRARLAGERSYLFVDSKTMVPFFQRFWAPSTRIIHVMHNSHLEPTSEPDGELNSRAPAVLGADYFDALVVLTEQQRQEILTRVPAKSRVLAIPNSVPLPTPQKSTADPGEGAMLASLVPRKQIGQALGAIALARQAGAEATLTIFGEGRSRENVEAVINRLELEQHVRLAGHVANAADRLTDYSFLLLTSKLEGFGLVIVEAMARGCIPISYDVRYGPRDIITDGVDGFLVPPNDTVALAAAISKVTGLDAPTLATIRSNAQASARRFIDSAVVKQWGEALDDLDQSTNPRTEIAVRLRKSRLRLATRRRARARARASHAQ